MKSEQIIPDKIYLIYDDTPEPRATWTTKKERWDDVEFIPSQKISNVRNYKIVYWDSKWSKEREEIISAYSADDALTIAEHRASKISDTSVRSINCM